MTQHKHQATVTLLLCGHTLTCKSSLYISVMLQGMDAGMHLACFLQANNITSDLTWLLSATCEKAQT